MAGDRCKRTGTISQQNGGTNGSVLQTEPAAPSKGMAALGAFCIVLATKAERPVSVQLADSRRAARQWASNCVVWAWGRPSFERVKAGATRHRAMRGCGLDSARSLGTGPVRWPARCAGQRVRRSNYCHPGAWR